MGPRIKPIRCSNMLLRLLESLKLRATSSSNISVRPLTSPKQSSKRPPDNASPLTFLSWVLMVAQLASTLFLVCATFLTLPQLFETPQLIPLFLLALLELVILRLRPPLKPTRWIALYRLFVDYKLNLL